MSKQYVFNQPSGYINKIRNIAIVGATGNSGKYMTESLLAKSSFNITAISRAGSSPPPDGIHLVTVDYSKPETLVEALRGQDVLIVTMAVSAPAGTASALYEAAAKAGVPWILPNEFGNDTDDMNVGDDTFVNQGKINERKAIETAGVSSWIGVCTGFWYEHSLSGPSWFGIDVLNKKCIFFDDGLQRLNSSTWLQVGRAVANLLSLPILPENEADQSVTLDSYRNRFTYVSSFAVNQREMLDSVQRVTKTRDADWEISSENSRERYEAAKQKMFAGDRAAFGRVLRGAEGERITVSR
ncbi:putative oxidoreductase CipA [Periconia macrospinosa]|uniref:Putative oxidoreductase CipA n=1 Tax=Periconia macrospinosa TaxID=97972 RepID=A0A2V1DUI9_9PLEO|nr:putative oxidoreductase CipA [Periconia macrospinosa]